MFIEIEKINVEDFAYFKENFLSYYNIFNLNENN